MGKTKEILKKNIDKEIVEVYSCSKDCCEKNNLTIDILYKAIKNGKIINGFTYEYSGNFTDEKKVYENGFKCPYCDEVLKNYNGLSKHIMHSHPEITKEQLLTDYYYNGVRPTCKCGCGQYTNITYDKNNNNQIKFAEYCKGHYSRVHNNWGHNEKAIEKSVETRRERFVNGTIKVWNKGSKWEDTFSEKKIKELKEMYKDEERNKKISDFFKGKPKSKEHADKIRERMSSEKTREFYRNIMKKRLENQEFSISSKLELDFIENFIKPLNIEYETQYYLKDIHQYCDIYVPSKNLVLEVDGSFWHCDKRLFPDGPKYDYQKKKIKLDEEKNKYCEEHGIKCLRIWEFDIINSPTEVQNLLKEELL